MSLTNHVSLVGLIRDRTQLPESVIETVVDDTIAKLATDRRWESVNLRRIPKWVANCCMDAAHAHKAKLDAELALDDADQGRGPWPVDQDDLARLLGRMFHIAPAPALSAAQHWIANVEANWGRSIDRRDLAAGDLLAVLEAVAEARR